jgi:hypothetical protein
MMSPQETNMRTVPHFNHPIKILVCGGRKYGNKAFMWQWLDLLSHSNTISHVITGGAPGADTLADAWAEDRCIQPVVCRALWKQQGTAAGPIRNRAMAELKPNLVLAFPGGNGTASMCAIARANKIQVLEVGELFIEEGPALYGDLPKGIVPALIDNVNKSRND